MINGIIVDLITPTHANGAPDYETVEILVDWHVDNGSSAHRGFNWPILNNGF